MTVARVNPGISVEELQNGSTKQSAKQYTHGRKKFNHYSFDIHKTPFEKSQSFIMILRVKSSLDKAEGSVADLYNKVNTYQSELRKVAAEGESTKTDKAFLLPIRRFLFAAEVSQKDVKLHS